MQPAMVIIGAGQAGVSAAVALRQRGWHGGVVLIGEESHLPYERPPLSKRALTSNEAVEPKTIQPATALQEHGITHITGRRVIAIDRATHSVRLDGGQEIGYVRLLLTTGARARTLPDGIADADSVRVLRTFDDALAIRATLTPGSRLILIGGGFIGLELAASAVQRGVTTTLMEAAPRLLMRGVPTSLAKLIDRKHRLAGVDILTSARLKTIRRCVSGTNTGEIEVSLEDQALQADSVIVGIGAIPNTELAEAAGIAIENGIAVDEQLLTSDPDIFAAGDCCSFPHGLYGGRRIRLESWKNACQQGVVAATNMLGGTQHYRAVPWFWSDHYDCTLQVTGLAEDDMTQVERPLPEGGLLVHGVSRDGRLLCASAFGRLKHVAKEVRAAEALIAGQCLFDTDSHAEPVALQVEGGRAVGT